MRAMENSSIIWLSCRLTSEVSIWLFYYTNFLDFAQ
jgi:hypothetical protein